MGHVVTKRESRAGLRSRLARACSAAAQVVPLLTVTVLPLVAGCTAILDIDKEQCSTEADCTGLFGVTAPYLCVENVCQRPTCAADAECRARGGAFASSICSETEQLCAPAQCNDNAQCGAGQTCDLGSNRCVKRDCDTTEECLLKAPSPTVQCMQGFCVDPSWECIGKPDNRPRNASESGTIRVKLLSSIDQKPVPGTTWSIKVCTPPQFDPECASPLAVPTPTYDAATGTVTITGLSYDMPVRMMFDETALKDPDGQTTLIPIDFYTQRPPVGDTEVPALRVVSRVGLKALVDGFAAISAQQGVTQVVNSALANIYGLVFDCEDKLAGQVALTYTNAIGVALNPPPVVLYFNEQNVPNLTRRFSYPTGVFSTLNIALENINVATSLVVSADATGAPTKVRDIRTDYTMKLAPYRQTTVHFYPRNYAAK